MKKKEQNKTNDQEKNGQKEGLFGCLGRMRNRAGQCSKGNGNKNGQGRGKMRGGRG